MQSMTKKYLLSRLDYYTTTRQLMVSKEILEEVYQFIKEHENFNKRQVENGLKKYSRLTVRNAIDDLISNDGKVTYRKDKPRGFYHLYVNDKNEFNILLEEIDQLHELLGHANYASPQNETKETKTS